MVAVHADKAPELDGTLNDANWQDASLVTNFHQREPFERQPPTEKTEVRIVYDSRYLYFGIHCFDSDPKKIVATELRRDADFSVDDNFTVLISPNNDKRNGYTFTTNALGTQFDAWHGFLRTPADWTPVVRSIWLSAIYIFVPLFAAYVVFLRRDVAGE